MHVLCFSAFVVRAIAVRFFLLSKVLILKYYVVMLSLPFVGMSCFRLEVLASCAHLLNFTLNERF